MLQSRANGVALETRNWVVDILANQHTKQTLSRQVLMGHFLIVLRVKEKERCFHRLKSLRFRLALCWIIKN